MLPRPQKQVEPTGGIMQHDKSSGSVDHRLKPVVDGSLNLVVSPQTVVVPTTDSVERGIGGGGGAGGGTFNKDETSQRLGGVILPPSSSTFRRLKEHRDQQEEFVIRERYLSRPALLSLGGEDEGGQQPGIKYQAWSAHPDHAPHIGPRQSSTMRTPETPEEFRLRVLRTTESMKGGPATASAGRGMSSPVNDHPAILYPSPSSFYTKQARMGDSTTSPRPSTHTSAVATPPNQELRYHPFAQDSLFRHRSPNKPFKTGPEPGTTMTTNSSGGSIESPAHLQYQLRQSPLARPPQKQPSSSSAEKQDLKSHSPQHQQTWHRPVRDTPPTRTSNTTPTSSLAPVKIAKDAAASVVVDFPTHFRLGTLIQLSNGDLKTVETLTTLDFVQSAETSPEVNIDHSVVTTLDLDIDKGMANITFSVGKQKVQVAVEATLEHPFFVVDQGWSSASPDRTLAKYRLPCKQLRVGDICISLTHCEVPQQQGQGQFVAAAPHLGVGVGAGDKMMKPPPPPAELLMERRRSNSASPSDKILKRTYYSTSMVSGSSPSPLAFSASSRPAKSSVASSSPSKQVVFADPVVTKTEADVIAKRRNLESGATTS